MISYNSAYVDLHLICGQSWPYILVVGEGGVGAAPGQGSLLPQVTGWAAANKVGGWEGRPCSTITQECTYLSQPLALHANYYHFGIKYMV